MSAHKQTFLQNTFATLKYCFLIIQFIVNYFTFDFTNWYASNRHASNTNLLQNVSLFLICFPTVDWLLYMFSVSRKVGIMAQDLEVYSSLTEDKERQQYTPSIIVQDCSTDCDTTLWCLISVPTVYCSTSCATHFACIYIPISCLDFDMVSDLPTIWDPSPLPPRLLGTWGVGSGVWTKHSFLL